MTDIAINPMTEIDPILVELRQILDEKEGLESQLKDLSERRQAIESKLMDFHQHTKLKSLSGGGMSISFDPESFRAKYDPEKWAGIFKWAAETGHEYLIQRRLTDTKVMELVDNGVALPDGLNVEQYTKISVRRK